MTSPGDAIAALAESRLVATIPADGEPDKTLVVAEILVQEGFEVLAVAPGRLDLLPRLREALGGRALLGAYGLTTPGHVLDAVTSEAAFALTSTGSETLVGLATSRELPVFAGAFTPTEIATAWSWGPTGVYVHPADTVGVTYAPHAVAAAPDAPMLVSGGSPYAVGQWLAAGTLAVVTDSSLVLDTLTGGDLGYLRERARNYVTEARSAASWVPRLAP